MKCKDAKKYLSSFQDGELAEQLRLEMSTHLNSCPSCANELLLMNNLAKGIKQLPQVDTPDYFTARIMGAIAQKERSTRVFLPSWATAAVFIVFCIIGLLLNPTLKKQSAGPVKVKPTQPVASIADYSTLLSESRQLNLIEIQDETMEMVYNEAQDES